MIIGFKPAEFIFIAGVFVVVASVAIGVIYVAVRLALRHERKNSK